MEVLALIKPDDSFYLFGMGNRRKFIYKQGKLIDLLTKEIQYKWDVIEERIAAEDYQVTLYCRENQVVTIFEDEQGLWLDGGANKECLAASTIRLPDFKEYSRSALLRILHHELLVNVVEGEPVPNLFVYNKPWYRDAAMMAMCFKTTNNLHLIKDWILALNQPYDRNNSGVSEPDNLGQALYLISLVSDQNHPLVDVLLSEAEKCRKKHYILGQSDFAEHPVYQTKWLKFGLKHLNLPDTFEIPQIYDSYSSIFWMDYCDQHVIGPGFDQQTRQLYPYLAWAESHFHNWTMSQEFFSSTYPLTWEWKASEAYYPGIEIVAKSYADNRFAAPHTWHAAEMFLYLLNI